MHDLDFESRPSTKRSQSNPILQSEIAYTRGTTLRDKEARQLACLEDLQLQAVPLHRIPRFERVDASSLVKSSERIGIVGLVVDNQGVGLVTKILARQNTTWKISPNLPFHQQHIQPLIQRLLDGFPLGNGLPELLSFAIDHSLDERCEGDSMDIACLLSIIDCLNGCCHPTLGAVAAVVSPARGKELNPSGFIKQKLDAFCREFERGTLLIRFRNCREASRFDCFFDEVWQVETVDQLADHLIQQGLLKPMLNTIPLNQQHATALSSYLKGILVDEARYPEAQRFLDRLKHRINEETPLLMRYEILLVEEELNRHRGEFDGAIQARAERRKLERMPHVTTYQRMIESDTQFAASLYDAHRFAEAAEILLEHLSLIELKGEGICSAEIRAYMLNTLARNLTILGKGEWEKHFRESIEIQEHISPIDIPRTRNFLIHSLLKNNRTSAAIAEFEYVVDRKNPYAVWLSAELARLCGITWDANEDSVLSSTSKTDHVYGFMMQAAARQTGRTRDQRFEYLRNAQNCFEYGTDPEKPNIKLLLAAASALGAAVTLQDDLATHHAIRTIQSFLDHQRCKSFKAWYQDALDRIIKDPTWENVDQFFSRIPLF